MLVDVVLVEVATVVLVKVASVDVLVEVARLVLVEVVSVDVVLVEVVVASVV